MLKKHFFLWCFVCFVCIQAESKNDTTNYNWVEQPVLHELSEEENNASAIVIKHKIMLNYDYDENEDLNLYETQHKIVRVNDAQAIEGFNKVFVPMNDVLEFVELKARAIGVDGSITELNKDNIKEVEDFAQYGAFKLFAIEGVEKGGEVEYFYTTRSLVSEVYGRYFFQSNVKVKEASLSIVAPKQLIFEAKGYNGFPEMTIEETESKRILTGMVENLSPMMEEYYAYDRPNLTKVAYKLVRNSQQPMQKDLYDWEMAANWFRGSIYSYSEEGKKAIQQQLKAMKLKKIKSSEEKIKAIENWIKENIAFQQGSGADFMFVDKILVNKYANEAGFTRLFAAFLEQAEIGHELLITSDRTQSRFDKDFADWNNFTELLFYFPAYDRYIPPAVPYLRFNYPPAHIADNHGLFVPLYGKPEVRYIPLPKAEQSINTIDASINFDEAFNVDLNIDYSWTGYRAGEFRAVYEYQKEAIDERITSGMANAQIKDKQIVNESLALNGNPDEPFVIKSQLTANSLVEKAGKSYLFKIGEIIGSQMELYQEQERQNSIEMPYPTYYKRTIEFTIPDGYSLGGLEDVKIDKFMEGQDGKKVNRFLSDYKQEGNKVTVTANEYYESIRFPKEAYESFREVINAAADFNKVVLVFEKESN